MQISIWNIRLLNSAGQLIEEQRNANTVHLEGEQYILSAAFATNLKGFGVAPASLYLGLDVRPKILARDVLADAANKEPTAASYKRMPISTQGGFAPVMQDPREQVDIFGENQKKVFTLQVSAVFTAETEDFGTINNCFITTAAEGSKGALILSSPLRHSFNFYEGYKLTAQSIISLRAAIL